MGLRKIAMRTLESVFVTFPFWMPIGAGAVGTAMEKARVAHETHAAVPGSPSHRYDIELRTDGSVRASRRGGAAAYVFYDFNGDGLAEKVEETAASRRGFAHRLRDVSGEEQGLYASLYGQLGL